MSAEREQIASGTRFSNGVLTVMKDHVFGWVVLLRDNPKAEEEAYTIDELPDEIKSIVERNAGEQAFPEEFREYLRQFDCRPAIAYNRKLH